MHLTPILNNGSSLNFFCYGKTFTKYHDPREIHTAKTFPWFLGSQHGFRSLPQRFARFLQDSTKLHSLFSRLKLKHWSSYVYFLPFVCLTWSKTWKTAKGNNGWTKCGVSDVVTGESQTAKILPLKENLQVYKRMFLRHAIWVIQLRQQVDRFLSFVWVLCCVAGRY